MSSYRPTSRLEIQLLGSPRAYVDGKPLDPPPSKRAWELLILMLLSPLTPPQRVKELFGGERNVTKAKSELRKALGYARDWVDDGPHVYRMTGRPRVDYWDRPKDGQEAFDYCVDRGDLLPGYSHMPLVEEERKRHHARLAKITRQLIPCQKSPGKVEALLERAQAVLPDDYIKALRRQCHTIEVGANDEVETTLHLLQSHVNDSTVERGDAARLQGVVDELAQTGQHWLPTSQRQIEWAAALVSILAPTGSLDLDGVYVKLANAFYLGNDLYRAVELLRPWLASGNASHNAFCTAALYNLALGYTAEAESCFDRAYQSPSADFRATVREKRDIQLCIMQGNPPRVSATLMADDPGYNAMSPGSRASVWCNAARAQKNAKNALELAREGRKIDSGTENPHYEFDLLRYARAAGEKKSAERYEAEVKELMEVPRPPGFRLAEMSLRAEDLWRTFSATPARGWRARMGEAEALWREVYQGWHRALNRPRMCRALLRRTEVAERLGAVEQAYEYATTAYVLGKDGGLRYARQAQALRGRLHDSHPEKQWNDYEDRGRTEAYSVARPEVLTVPGSSV